MHFSAAQPTSFQVTFAKPRIVNLSMVGVLLIILLIACPNLRAQQPTEPPAAPLPAQILSARKVFIGNTFGDRDVRIAKYVGGPDGIYNQFYADVKNGGRFEPVGTPADADLVLDVTLGVFPLNAGYAAFRLSILDPKSNVLLWTIAEPIDPAFLAKTWRRNLTQALGRLADDLKALTPGK